MAPNLPNDSTFVDAAIYGGLQQIPKPHPASQRCAMLFFIGQDELRAVRGQSWHSLDARPASIVQLADDGRVYFSPGSFSAKPDIRSLAGNDYGVGEGSYHVDALVGGLVDLMDNPHQAIRITGIASGTSSSPCDLRQHGEVGFSSAVLRRYALSGGENPMGRYMYTPVKGMMEQLYRSVVMQQIGHNNRIIAEGKSAYQAGEMFAVTFGTGNNWSIPSGNAWAPAATGGWIDINGAIN